ncbi:MAG: MerR family transcriptional regulator [Acidobacteriota bacterium]|jgi:DNA-binding transcriptional MerR regulator|nr:MerR family transcriptional regulator [Acidobacteriota bacterium]
MMTANILAKKSDVSLYTVRHYTRIGLLKPVRNSNNNYKIYQPSDTVRVRFIKAAGNLGFSLTEIADVLDEAKHGKSPCPMVREIIVRRIEENRRKIKEMQKLQKKMENALEDWSRMKDSMPNGDSVCHLIESVGEIAN